LVEETWWRMYLFRSAGCSSARKILEVFETEIVGWDTHASKTVLLFEDAAASSQLLRGGSLISLDRKKQN
jgi:hypothetical protein